MSAGSVSRDDPGMTFWAKQGIFANECRVKLGMTYEPIRFRLQEQAAIHGCTAEQEAKSILEKLLAPEPHPQGIGTRIHQLFQKIGGVELDLPSRSLPRPAAVGQGCFLTPTSLL
jgi:plasmid stability protein